MDAPLLSKYALISRITKLRLHYIPEMPRDTVGGRGKTESDEETTVEAGTLIKVFQNKTPPTYVGSKTVIAVQVLDMVNQLPIYENLFECAQSNLLRVDEHLWPYVISIENPDVRLNLVKDTKHCKWFPYLKVKDFVSVSGDMFGNSYERYDCIIRYIGPVIELHPVGYFFGLELLHLESGNSPQADKIPFSFTYVQTDPSLTIFATANWLLPISKEVTKKSSTRDLISGIGDKLLAAIGPSSAVLGGGGGGGNNSNTSSLQRGKKGKGKNKEPTAQFYDKIGADKTDSAIKDMESKKDVSNILPADNEECKRRIENYERSLEHRGTNTVQTQTNPQSGILKNNRKDNVKTSSSTGRKLGFRDIPFNEIDESSRNEGAVSGVEKNEVDLHDVLGRDWPTTAGDAAELLNKPKFQNSLPTFPPAVAGAAASGGGISSANIDNQSKYTNRNKSSNSVSHALTTNAKSNKNIEKKLQMLSSLLLSNFDYENMEIGRASTATPSEASSLYHNIPLTVLEFFATSPIGSPIEYGSYLSEEHIKSSNRGSSYPPQNQAYYENYDKIEDSDSQPLYANESYNDLIETDGYDGGFADDSTLPEIPGTDLVVGSVVEVNLPDCNGHLYGVIRWIGLPPNAKTVIVGVELEEDYIDKQLPTTDGGYKGISLFKCAPGRGLFVTTEQCFSDRRFSVTDGAIGNDVSIINNNFKAKHMNGGQDDQQPFGHMECPVVPGAVAPIKCLSLNELEELCGKFKGIQGHHNSCYLDVTLFSMFAFTPVFDAVLYRPPEKEDIPHYTEVQKVLREEIVNPLRKHMFVRADRVMKLRQLLDKLSSVSGLTSEEKDPEEFLNCILAQILRAEPFLKLNSGQDAYYYQLFVEKDERLLFPSVQQLFEQSFYTSDIKLKEVPSCLIIQMPRFGKNFKMYPRILPSQVLDVTDIIEDSPRQCTVCGKLAEFECRDCFGIMQSGVSLESTSFCPGCLETVHKHAKRSNHKHRKLLVPQDFRVMADHMAAPRLYMELFAVVCIETSHYVTFVKAGSGPDAPWCFFDSMADRKGELNGYNIPEMITVPDLPQWLSDEGARSVNETSSNDKMLPEHAKRLFCDAYMCMYQSTDVMMYR